VAKRGPYAKTDAVKEQIVEAGIEVFSKRGFNKGSLREIADLVGMTEGAMLYHFPTKAHLMQAIGQARADRERTDRAFQKPGRDLIERFISIQRKAPESRGIVQLHTLISSEATSADHPVHDLYVHRYAALRDELRASFEVIREQGQLRPGVTPAFAAASMIALMDGLNVQWLLDDTSVDLAGEVETFLSLILIEQPPR
jgi:AcrR family transcriptional regulator